MEQRFSFLKQVLNWSSCVASNIGISDCGRCPLRWIRNVFRSLATMSAIFAAHGKQLPANEVIGVQELYMQYRDSYNSF